MRALLYSASTAAGRGGIPAVSEPRWPCLGSCRLHGQCPCVHVHTSVLEAAQAAAHLLTPAPRWSSVADVSTLCAPAPASAGSAADACRKGRSEGGQATLHSFLRRPDGSLLPEPSQGSAKPRSAGAQLLVEAAAAQLTLPAVHGSSPARSCQRLARARPSPDCRRTAAPLGHDQPRCRALQPAACLGPALPASACLTCA